MPDPLRKTVSASQVAAMFNASKWNTRLGLYHWLKTGEEDDREDERMTVGKLLEDDILTLVQQRYGLDIEHVPQGPESYVQHPEHPVGCTLDARCSCPVRGLAVVEAKNVDTSVFYREWSFDEERELVAAPAEIELQVQAEMLATGSSWAILAALVGGNTLYCLERKPDPAIHARIVKEAREVLLEVAEGREPPAQGLVDYDLIASLLPPVFEAGTVDLRSGLDGKGNDEAWDLMSAGVAYEDVKERRLLLEKEEKRLKGLLLDASRRHDGAGYIMMDDGALAYSRGKDTMYRLPEEVHRLLRMVSGSGTGIEGIEGAVEAVLSLEFNVARKGGVKVKWKERD